MNQEDMPMLIVCGLDGDPNDPFVAVTTPGTNVGQAVKTIAGVRDPRRRHDDVERR
jgi:hypothetical protein